MPETKSTPAPATKVPPAAEPKKTDAPAPVSPNATEPKKPDAPGKAADPKAPAATEPKKPDTPGKTADPKVPTATEPKKPDVPNKAADPKAPAAPEPKKPDAPGKAAEPKAPTAATEPKKPDVPGKATDPKPPAAADPKPKEGAKEPPKGMKITQVFADRLEKPGEADLKKLPIPNEGDGFSMRLHPAYFFQFLDHPFSVNRETQDYKELFESIKENGINEPVKARPRKDGGLELLSGHRRHDVATQLNYPVPVVIVQEDDDTARIEVVDGNLHRQDIPTTELARAAKMKMEALTRKAGRRSKMDKLTSPQKRTDQIVAEDMGTSRNQVQRLVRIDSLIPDLKRQVDDKTLPFNTAVELSYLTPTEQHSVADFIKKEQTVPSLAHAQTLKQQSQQAAKAAKEATPGGVIHSHNFTSSLPSAQAPSTPAPTAPSTEKKLPPPVTEKSIASLMKPKTEPEIKVIFTGSELRTYFNGKQPTVPEAKRAVFEAMDMRKKALEKQAQKQEKPGKTPAR